MRWSMLRRDVCQFVVVFSLFYTVVTTVFQQYVVDAYVETEGSRLYLKRPRLNQKDIRVKFYRGLLNALTTRASNINLQVGKLIILPLSSQGSPRSMQ
ncbi:hypothetical protein AVEN_140275-1 [Araneus ventricosus]|uniref:Helitron helicase-like domain-containing protein n=1 Tax=Araneus ventricosus TaxID=182803 RepID=A0A4Y2SCR9_ARAVE|nr:hypothetical protein AVEN_140275-1 [Araneus ventricosus]